MYFQVAIFAVHLMMFHPWYQILGLIKSVHNFFFFFCISRLMFDINNKDIGIETIISNVRYRKLTAKIRKLNSKHTTCALMLQRKRSLTFLSVKFFESYEKKLVYFCSTYKQPSFGSWRLVVCPWPLLLQLFFFVLSFSLFSSHHHLLLYLKRM